MNTAQREELAAHCRAVRWDVDMGAYSTFRTGGVVEAMAEVDHAEELAQLVRWLSRHQIPWRVIGGGSNILVATPYLEGVFIRLRDTAPPDCRPSSGAGEKRESCIVQIGAGYSLAAFVAWCVDAGLAGLEFMAGIPGTVGGAIRMNAGAFGRSISEPLLAVRCMNRQGEVFEARKEEIAFSYRQSVFPGEPAAQLLVTCGIFALFRAEKEAVAARCREIIGQRRQKQPVGFGSAGSVFKNPVGDFAGRLIEQAGLKGRALGKAIVSPQHANFILNTGGATPEDIVGLIQEVRDKVLEYSGILLEPEIHIF